MTLSSIPMPSGQALALKRGSSNLRHIRDAMTVPIDTGSCAVLVSTETFPHHAEVLVPHPGITTVAKASLLPGKPCCPWRLPGSPGTLRLGACVLVCPLSRFSRKVAMIYEPWTVLAECSGGLDYSFPEEAVCLEMAR